MRRRFLSVVCVQLLGVSVSAVFFFVAAMTSAASTRTARIPQNNPTATTHAIAAVEFLSLSWGAIAS